MQLTTTQLAALTVARVCEYESTLNDLRGDHSKGRTLYYRRFREAVRKAHQGPSFSELKRAEVNIQADADHCLDPKQRAMLLENERLLSIYSESFARPLSAFSFEAPGLRRGLISEVEGMTIRYKPHLAVLSEGLRLTYIHLFCSKTDTPEKVRIQLRLIAEILMSNIPNFEPSQLVGYMCHSGKKVKAGFLSSVDRHRVQAIARHLKVIGII
jgi:hypothetical protein